jgi:hypothetical protein
MIVTGPPLTSSNLHPGREEGYDAIREKLGEHYP